MARQGRLRIGWLTRTTLSLLVGVLAAGALALAQVAVSGVVQDPSGATISGAGVVPKGGAGQGQHKD